MFRHEWAAAWQGLACCTLLLPCGVTAAESLPLAVRSDPQPGSLMRWHLYERLDERPRVGDQLTFIGRYDAAERSISLASPPWLTITLPRTDADGGEAKTHQAFAFACDPVKGLDQHGLARFTGQIALHRPDLTPHEKSNRNLPVFRWEPVTVEPLRLARAPEELLTAAADDIRLHAPRLHELCAKFALTYDFDRECLLWSWYEGQLACTTIVTRHPRFSFTPVPYATISILYDPASGKPARLIFTRRIWQDPRD